jgi:hypothetical protein
MGWVAVRSRSTTVVVAGELSAGFIVPGREVVVEVYGVVTTMPQG